MNAEVKLTGTFCDCLDKFIENDLKTIDQTIIKLTKTSESSEPNFKSIEIKRNKK